MNLFNGLTSKEMAKVLFLSEKTVWRHIANVCKKLGFKNKDELLAFYAKKELPGKGD